MGGCGKGFRIDVIFGRFGVDWEINEISFFVFDVY